MTALLTGRFLAEYARRPLNLVLLALVPVVFVAMSAGALADFASILGGPSGSVRLETATAGWAASFLAGVATFFHVVGSRDADRRLASARSSAAPVVAARLVSALLLAAVAAGGALLALALRGDIADPSRVVAATAMSAVIYLGVGATVGAFVRSEVNGSLTLIFVWMVDVFFGPGMGQVDALVSRFFPTHFPTLVVLEGDTTHAGAIGDLGASLLWTVGGLLLAFAALVVTTRSKGRRRRRRAPAGWLRQTTGLRFAWREYRRDVALWVLLVGLPVLFITLSIVVTPDGPAPVELTEGGRTGIQVLSMTAVHGAIMVPITVAFLAGLAGLFVVLGSAEADRRLVLTGFRPREVLGARLGVIALAAALVTTVSLTVTAFSFSPAAWPAFAGATLIVALTYALIGVVVGPLVGRLGGLYLMFLLPFLDVGLAQNVMFGATPPTWGAWLPARGATQVLVDAAFTSSFDERGGLVLAVAWLAAIALASVGVFHRLATSAR